MKKIISLRTIAVAAILLCLPGLFLPGQAAGHGIGIDLIKLADENQDGGMFNIHGQIGLTGDLAMALGYASGDEMTISEAGVKYYFGRYMSSPFIQLGAGYFDHDTGDDTGFIGSLGLERKITRHIGISSAIKIISGLDTKYSGYPESPIFQAAFSIMLAF